MPALGEEPMLREGAMLALGEEPMLREVAMLALEVAAKGCFLYLSPGKCRKGTPRCLGPAGRWHPGPPAAGHAPPLLLA